MLVVQSTRTARDPVMAFPPEELLGKDVLTGVLLDPCVLSTCSVMSTMLSWADYAVGHLSFAF